MGLSAMAKVAGFLSFGVAELDSTQDIEPHNLQLLYPFVATKHSSGLAASCAPRQDGPHAVSLAWLVANTEV